MIIANQTLLEERVGVRDCIKRNTKGRRRGVWRDGEGSLLHGRLKFKKGERGFEREKAGKKTELAQAGQTQQLGQSFLFSLFVFPPSLLCRFCLFLFKNAKYLVVFFWFFSKV
jgi:hypothetical protein